MTRSTTSSTTSTKGSARRQWFAEQVERLLPGLMATAVRLTRDRTGAEDLVADALVKALSGLDSLNEPEALGTWLHRIVTNTFISQQRTSESRATVETYDEGAEAEAGFSLFERLHQPFLLWQSDPERDFLNRLLRDDLTRAIDALPDAFRPAVVLVDVQGFSYREAAESLCVPVGTIRSRLARGRSLLQEALWTQAVDAGFHDDEATGAGPGSDPARGGTETDSRRGGTETDSRGSPGTPDD